MPSFAPDPSLFDNLKDKVVVLTGGANGVGEQVVEKLHELGAHVVFGDIDTASCSALVERLTTSSTSTAGLDYLTTDVRSYEANLALFKLAFSKYQRVDHAFAIAGITEQDNWFSSNLDLTTIETPPPTTIIDINLTGLLYFSRIAAVYLRQNNPTKSLDKSLVLLGSIASFKEQAGLFVYQPSKHGVLGLVRSARQYFTSELGIRLNAVCPCLIATKMATRVQGMWESHGLPINTPQEIADYVLTLAAMGKGPVGEKSGLAVYVEGGVGWEIEEGLLKTEPVWLGEQLAESAAKVHDMLGIGLGWTTVKK